MVECLLTLLVVESPFVVVTETCKAFRMWMKTFSNESRFLNFFVASMNFAIAAAAARGDWLVGASEII